MSTISVCFKRVTIVFLLLVINLFGFSIPQKTQAADTRPADCTTKFPSDTLQRCATTSAAGYTLYLWRGDKTKTGPDDKFVFVGSSDFGNIVASGIGKWIYRSTSDPNFYIAVGTGTYGLEVTHHYRVGVDTAWNQYATAVFPDDRNYFLMSGSQLPEYKNAIDSSTNQKFVWRIVANGKVLLNGAPAEGAYIKMHLDQTGPPLGMVNNGKDGTFEFSHVGTNEDIWINQGTVNKLNFYIGLTKDGKNYEITKYIDIPSGWKNHSDSNTKLITLGDINFTDSNKVDTLAESSKGQLPPAEEAASDGGSACEQKCKLSFLAQFSISSQIQGALCSMQCALISWEAQIVSVVVEKVLYPALGLDVPTTTNIPNPSNSGGSH